jgi:NADPH:quinone reductase-like Zn-dependent oxidoreductase
MSSITTDTMQAIATTPDGPSWAELRTVPVPKAAPDEALIAVRAFALNRGELRLLATRDDGWVPGQDVAGIVERAAADGSGPPAGTRVAGLADWHGWAQYAPVPTRRIAPLPGAVSFAQAAALPMAGTTALNLIRRGGSLLGRRVLVTGASGGVGTYAVQLAEMSGARVTAVARAGEADRLRERGAADVVADIADATGAFDVILESVGGRSMSAAIERVAPQGLIVAFGNASGEPAPFDFAAFLAGGADARIETYVSYRQEAHAGADLGVLLDLLAAFRLAADVGLEAPWTELSAALDALRDRQVAGKAVLRVE